MVQQKGIPLKALSASLQPLQQLIDRFGNFLMSYFFIIIALLLGMLILAAFLGPILSYLGLDFLAKPLFFDMHLLCAQTPSHSFYLFGHQLCLCERCLAIYSSMFITSLTFIISKRRLPGISWWVWVLMSVPMALDGFTQMFGLRESTWELRLLTGALFGFGALWFLLPWMQKTLQEETAAVPQAPASRSTHLSPPGHAQ